MLSLTNPNLIFERTQLIMIKNKPAVSQGQHCTVLTIICHFSEFYTPPNCQMSSTCKITDENIIDYCLFITIECTV